MGRRLQNLLPLTVAHSHSACALLTPVPQVSDLASAGSVSREWRQLAAEADGGWRNAFLRDFGEHKAADVKNLRLWRERYM